MSLPIKISGILILSAIESYYFHCQQSLLEAKGILFDTIKNAPEVLPTFQLTGAIVAF